MRRNTYIGQRGFTLVELMVTVAVLVIVLAIAVPSFQAMTHRNRLTAITNEMVGALQLARVEAIRRNARVIFCPTTSGTACGGNNWRRSIVLAPGGEVVRELQIDAGNIVVSSSASINTGNQISFGASGFARAGTNVANRAGGLRICNTRLGSEENARDVMVNVSRVSVRNATSADCSAAPANQ